MKNYYYFFLPLLFLSLLFSHSYAYTDDEKARSIYNEVNERQNAITYVSSAIEMIIYDSRGRTRNREIQSWQFDSGDTSKILIIFASPADVRGTGLLTISEDGSEVQKLYLPAVGRVQTISGSRRTDRFAGSDFTFEDLGIQNPDNFDFRLADESDTQYVLHAQPTIDSQYHKIAFYINKKKYTLQKAAYFDEDENQIKELIAEDYQEVLPNVWLASKMTMKDLTSDRKTELIWKDRTVNEAIDESIFSERRLQRGI